MATKTALKEKTQTRKFLAQSLDLGPVELNVKNLIAMKNFYHTTLGLDVLAESPTSITLGKNGKPLVIIQRRDDLSLPLSSDAGLYHFAIVYTSRSTLAQAIKSILTHSPELFSGSADHLVSEAFYFYDPQGNGIELYFDRPKSLWQWENGQIKMATLYIDPVSYINQYSAENEEESKTFMGHIHLKVGDITLAEQFYVNILGFEVTAKLPGALFVSVGGYHHHIGLNTWSSLNSGKKRDSLGLQKFEFTLPQKEDLEQLRERLARSGLEFREEKSSLLVADPWNNQIVARIK